MPYMSLTEPGSGWAHTNILHRSSRTNRTAATGDPVREFLSYHFPRCITLGEPF